MKLEILGKTKESEFIAYKSEFEGRIKRLEAELNESEQGIKQLQKEKEENKEEAQQRNDEIFEKEEENKSKIFDVKINFSSTNTNQ